MLLDPKNYMYETFDSMACLCRKYKNLLWKKLTLSYEKIKNNNEACRNHVSRCSSLKEIFITGEETVIRSDK